MIDVTALPACQEVSSAVEVKTGPLCVRTGDKVRMKQQKLSVYLSYFLSFEGGGGFVKGNISYIAIHEVTSCKTKFSLHVSVQ